MTYVRRRDYPEESTYMEGISSEYVSSKKPRRQKNIERVAQEAERKQRLRKQGGWK